VGVIAEALRRWALHNGGFHVVVVAASLVSLLALDRVRGFDVYMCADCEWSCKYVSSLLSSSCTEMQSC
jgi:hypothetical protein